MPKLENKRNVNPLGDPGDPTNSDYTPIQTDLAAKDPWEGNKHAPATQDLDPNDVRQRPYPEGSTDTYPDDPAVLGFDK